MSGLRLDFKERRGLFSKSDRPKGYGRILAVGSPSGGSDLLWMRSNRGRPKQIGQTRGKRDDDGGAGRRETFPAAAPRRRGSNPALPWLIRADVGLWSMHSARLNLLST